jgi:hypothetical protein
MRVHCRIKQTTPAIGRPMVKKVSHGRIKEIMRRICFLFQCPCLREAPLGLRPIFIKATVPAVLFSGFPLPLAEFRQTAFAEDPRARTHHFTSQLETSRVVRPAPRDHVIQAHEVVVCTAIWSMCQGASANSVVDAAMDSTSSRCSSSRFPTDRANCSLSMISDFGTSPAWLPMLRSCSCPSAFTGRHSADRLNATGASSAAWILLGLSRLLLIDRMALQRRLQWTVISDYG